MGTFSKIILSGSTDGQGIAIAGTTPSANTLVHTAATGAASSVDEVYIYAYSTVTTPIAITLLWSTTGAGNRFTYTITGDDLGGLHLISPGLVLRNAKNIAAFVTTANVASIFGYVNRFAS